MTDLPPYTHVPGITPHPISDPHGHMGDADQQRKELSPAGMLAHGMLLFNLGFYWEAHEAWEHLWIALGRSGSEADIIKGLIKLAACGVKCLEANPVGASRHASRAANLLDITDKPDWLEVNLPAAHQIAAKAARSPPTLEIVSDGTPRALPDFELIPQRGGEGGTAFNP